MPKEGAFFGCFWKEQGQKLSENTLLFNFGTLYVQYEKARKRAQKNDTKDGPLCEIKALF